MTWHSEWSVLLDRLYDEILECIIDGVPYPNPVVYKKPWHRDAMAVGLVLERTHEVHRIREWILSLRDPFDRNNAGLEEPDNLGQSLSLVSLVADDGHPLVRRCLEELPRFLDGDGRLIGPTDFGPKPVYQAKWLKFGLRRLGLPDPYSIPQEYDPYSALFWMDFREQHVSGPPVIQADNTDYPYLQWAEAHFHQSAPPMQLLHDGDKLTWEAEASQADYERLPEAVRATRTCRPHSWHAAEAWLYLDDLRLSARAR